MGRLSKLGIVIGVVIAACSSGGDGMGGRDTFRQNEAPARKMEAAEEKGEPSKMESAGSAGDNIAVAPVVPPVSLIPEGDDADGEEMLPVEEVECVEGMRCYEPTLDEENCGKQELSSDVAEVERPGNLLLIYDRSASMDDPWEGRPKYQAAGDAIAAAIEPLADVLTVGAQFFPSLDPTGMAGCPCNVVDPFHWIPGPGACCLNIAAGSCVVTPLESTDQIDFRPAGEFVAELPNQWRLQGAGMTPLMTGMQQAAQAIESRQFEGPLSIVIVTDGVPNCGTTEGMIMQQVTQWQMAGYPTYVVGLPGIGEASALLNRLAQAGGSGQFIDPRDPKVLEDNLRQILLETVRTGIDSCTITLNPPAEAPEKLHLVVRNAGEDQDVARQLSDTAGWNVTADGAIVTLEGDLCDAAKGGQYERLRFEFGCVDLPPAPVPTLE